MKKTDNGFMIKLATFIVDKRNIIYMCFAIFLLYSIISIPKVKVNNDITSYLPETTQTRQGLDIMEEEFVTYATAKVMISNISYENGMKLCETVRSVNNVKDVEYDDTPEHYTSSAALLSVTFKDDGETEESIAAMENIRELLSPYDVYISTDVGQEQEDSKNLEDEMRVILAVAAVIILLVLLLTSQTYAEIIVFVLVFGVAALLNMGTNYWFGEISFISKSVAVVLQLALAIDYAIILAHRFAEEREVYPDDPRQAIIAALSKAIVEISSSSLTTVSGLVALTLMQLKIGMDLGIVLSKGIVFSLITVFLLMPGVLLQMSGLIERTKHKSFVPSIKLWGKFVVKTRFVFPFVFIAVIAGGMILSSRCEYAYDVSSVRSQIKTEKTIAEEKINKTFGITSQMAVIVPKGDYLKEGKILDEVSQLDRVTDAVGLANTEAEKNGITHVITDRLTPRELAEYMDMDYDTVCLLFQAYGLKNEEYGAFFKDIDECRLCLIDVLEFVKEEMDKEVINFDDEEAEEFNDTYDDLQDGKRQLEGETYSRLVFEYSGDVEGADSYEFLHKVEDIAHKYYDEVYVTSNTTSSFDMYEAFKTDNQNVSLLTIVFVFAILVLTFKSFGLPALLVLTIQGSIWINFSFPTIKGEKLYFLGYLVVSSIQMGATIDYAIVIANRYEELKKNMPHKEAVIKAIDEVFPTILTSGSILTMAGFLIGWISTDAVVATLGKNLGRGTLISIILVMLVLPQILLLCDKFIEKTYFKIKAESREKVNSDGSIEVSGRVCGYVNGYVDGIMKGTIKGSIEAKEDIYEEE
ncbi:MAG: MMPL family transporter [Clostridiales bacterium]|nr:MMPL family transporter [Clostridiales bacterium]